MAIRPGWLNASVSPRALWSLAALLLATPGAAAANSWELDPGFTGVPATKQRAAEPTCAVCHASRAAHPDGEATLELRGLPDHYMPGVRYSLSLAIAHPGADRLRWGFQLTAVAAQTLRRAGHFVVTDRDGTRAVWEQNGREYLMHTYPGTAIGKPDGQRWQFDWVAPLSDVGPIAFFAAGVAADADGSPAGDVVQGPAPSGTARLAPPEPARRAAGPEAPDAEPGSDPAE